MSNSEKNIKLLVLTHNYPRYKGDFAGIFIQLLCQKLVSEGISPIVLAPHDKDAPEYEESAGVKIYRFHYADTVEEQNLAYRGQMHNIVLGSVSGIFKFKRFLDSFRKSAEEIIEKQNIDIIAGHWLVPAGVVMKSLAKKHDIPMIISSHGTDIRLMRKYFNALYRYLGNFINALKGWTVVSSFLRDELLSLNPNLSSKLTVLPLPHDESVFYKDASIVKEENLIVAVTRFTEQKRVGFLVKAFALVSEKNDKARLEIYGEGLLKNEIENQIKKFGLQNKIEILKPVSQDKLRVAYSRAQVVVLNSFHEGFGLTLSEAMLCGTAVIGTNSGGIVDIIENDRTGLLVELDNAQALSEAMIKILSNSELSQKLATAGYEKATADYASEALAKKYAEIVKNSLQ